MLPWRLATNSQYICILKGLSAMYAIHICYIYRIMLNPSMVDTVMKGSALVT